MLSVSTDHECLQAIRKIGETKPRFQRWTDFLSAYNLSLSYRRSKDHRNADILSRIPLPPTEEGMSDSCALSDPVELGVYLIRARGLIPFS